MWGSGKLKLSTIRGRAGSDATSGVRKPGTRHCSNIELGMKLIQPTEMGSLVLSFAHGSMRTFKVDSAK